MVGPNLNFTGKIGPQEIPARLSLSMKEEENPVHLSVTEEDFGKQLRSRWRYLAGLGTGNNKHVLTIRAQLSLSPAGLHLHCAGPKHIYVITSASHKCVQIPVYHALSRTGHSTKWLKTGDFDGQTCFSTIQIA